MTSLQKTTDTYTITKFVDAKNYGLVDGMKKVYEKFIGHTNDREFLGFTRGSLLCVGIEGSRVGFDGKWEIEYRFEHTVGKWSFIGVIHDIIFGSSYVGYKRVNFYDYGFDKFDRLTKE